MAKKYLNVPENRHSNRALIIILIIVMTSLIAVMTATLFQTTNQFQANQAEQSSKYFYPQFISFDNSTFVSMYLPAVDDNGKGILTTLGVEAVSGTGKVLVDIENLVFWDDTQTSIRIAQAVSSEITGKNLNKYDLVYTIHTNASMVGGPSAGAAITIATIAALENKKLRDDVMITGSINEDGLIGQVSGVAAKAEAAKQINVTTFLVPIGQSKTVVYDIKKECKKVDDVEYCSIEQTPRQVDISKEVGIKIVEISSIEEAMDYFFE